MAEVDVSAMLSDIEKLAQQTAASVETSMNEEYVATAADDLVTATAVGGRTTIDIHVLAKRRLDREELGAAVVEAVRAVEERASQAFTAFFDDQGLEAFSPRGKALFAETMGRLRAQFPL